MTTNHLVTSTPRLGHADEAAYRQLLKLCNADEGIDLPFFFDAAALISEARTAFFVWDESTLIGFGHLPNDPTPEGCLMVHPHHRRQGCGTAILTAMQVELQRRGMLEALLVADQGSASASAFLGAAALPYRSSEFRLELDRSAIDRTRPRISGLAMRVAHLRDTDALVNLLVAAFDHAPADARDFVERGLNERSRGFHLALLNGEAVGVLRAGEIDGSGDITAFGVRPDLQRRGIGRQMLIETIDLLTAAGLQKIVIEVATVNAHALGLYESCGFRVASEYGFYSATAEGNIELLLVEMLREIQSVLGERLVGFYLYGSAATGGFEPGISDLDLLAATEGDLTESDIEQLRDTHALFIQRHRDWDDRIEVVYLSVEALGSFKTRRSRIAVISPGEPLHFRDEGAARDWLMNWHLVTHGGRTLFGPSPANFIALTTHAEFVDSLCAHVLEGEPWMVRASTRQAQSYVILTLCRTLVAINTGAHASKREAAEWVQENVSRWSDLAGRAIAWRTDPTAADRADPESFAELVAFFAFVHTAAAGYTFRA